MYLMHGQENLKIQSHKDRSAPTNRYNRGQASRRVRVSVVRKGCDRHSIIQWSMLVNHFMLYYSKTLWRNTPCWKAACLQRSVQSCMSGAQGGLSAAIFAVRSVWWQIVIVVFIFKIADINQTSFLLVTINVNFKVPDTGNIQSTHGKKCNCSCQ